MLALSYSEYFKLTTNLLLTSKFLSNHINDIDKKEHRNNEILVKLSKKHSRWSLLQRIDVLLLTMGKQKQVGAWEN